MVTLEKYRNKKTVIHVTCQKHWDLIIPNLRKKSISQFNERDFTNKDNVILYLYDKGFETYGDLKEVENEIVIKSDILFNDKIHELWK